MPKSNDQYLSPSDPPTSLGGKCPLEMLQMTCAAIGRDSPKPASASSAYQSAASSTPASSTNNQPRERALSVNDDTNISVVSADSTKSRGKASLKRKAEPVPENKKDDTPKTPASKRRSSPINPLPSKSAKYSPSKSVFPELSTAATDASLLSHLSITNPTLYRQLTASASWPSAAAYASAAYPLGLTGLTQPHVGYNPYLYPAWSQLGLSSLTSSLSSAFPLNLPQLPEQPAEPDKACNWGNCSEKFSTTEALGEHVKEVHLSNASKSASEPVVRPTTSTPTALPTPSLHQMAAARYAPYTMRYGARELANHFVYS